MTTPAQRPVRYTITVERRPAPAERPAPPTSPPIELLLDVPWPPTPAWLLSLVLRASLVCRRQDARLRAVAGSDLASTLAAAGLHDFVAQHDDLL